MKSVRRVRPSSLPIALSGSELETSWHNTPADTSWQHVLPCYVGRLDSETTVFSPEKRASTRPLFGIPGPPLSERRRELVGEPIFSDERVSLVNASDESWCGSLSSDEEDNGRRLLEAQIGQAVQNLRKRRDVRRRARFMTRTASNESLASDQCRCCSATASEETINVSLKDKAARVLQQRLAEGAILQLEYIGEAGNHMRCPHPYCPVQPEHVGSAFCVLLRFPTDQGHVSCHCLPCLEGISNAAAASEEMSGGTAANCYVLIDREQVLDINLDGRSNLVLVDSLANLTVQSAKGKVSGDKSFVAASMLASKHAPRPGMNYADDDEATLPNTLEQDAAASTVQPCSSAKLRRPSQQRLQPFQYLAPYIVPGLTLATSHVATLEMWKLASKEQLGGIVCDGGGGFVYETSIQYIMKKLGKQACNQSDPDAVKDAEHCWSKRTTIQKKDCYGQNLSTVLARLNL